jgi:hypothetical protein
MPSMSELLSQAGSFERYEKLALLAKGDKANVTFLDEGRDVSAEIIATAMREKGKTSRVKAQDSTVFVIDTDSGKREFWVKHTQFTNIRELRAVMDANGGKLKGAKALIERVAVGDPNTPNIKITAR